MRTDSKTMARYGWGPSEIARAWCGKANAWDRPSSWALARLLLGPPSPVLPRSRLNFFVVGASDGRRSARGSRRRRHGIMPEGRKNRGMSSSSSSALEMISSATRASLARRSRWTAAIITPAVGAAGAHQQQHDAAQGQHGAPGAIVVL